MGASASKSESGSFQQHGLCRVAEPSRCPESDFSAIDSATEGAGSNKLHVILSGRVFHGGGQLPAQRPRYGRVEGSLELPRRAGDGQVVLQHARVHLQFQFEIRPR